MDIKLTHKELVNAVRDAAVQELNKLDTGKHVKAAVEDAHNRAVKRIEKHCDAIVDQLHKLDVVQMLVNALESGDWHGRISEHIRKMIAHEVKAAVQSEVNVAVSLSLKDNP